MECRKLGLYWIEIFFMIGPVRYVRRVVVNATPVATEFLTKSSDDMMMMFFMN